VITIYHGNSKHWVDGMHLETIRSPINSMMPHPVEVQSIRCCYPFYPCCTSPDTASNVPRLGSSIDFAQQALVLHSKRQDFWRMQRNGPPRDCHFVLTACPSRMRGQSRSSPMADPSKHCSSNAKVPLWACETGDRKSGVVLCSVGCQAR
jgi:hypothetical protein